MAHITAYAIIASQFDRKNPLPILSNMEERSKERDHVRSLGVTYNGLQGAKQDIRLEGGKGTLQGLVGSSFPPRVLVLIIAAYRYALPFRHDFVYTCD
jgi:hypothetical protein